MNEEKELLNDSKIIEVINELKDKKEKDLLMVYKFEESIKHKYDTMINFFENLKNRINEFKNSINQSFMLFKSEYNNNNNFEPNSLLQSIELSFNKTNKLNFEFYPFFNQYQEPQNSFYCKIFNFRKFLYLPEVPEYIISNSFSYYFHDFSIIILPKGITGKENKLSLGIRYNSEMERKYEIKVYLQMINKNTSNNIGCEITLFVNQNNLVVYNDLCIFADLEKNGFIQNDGNLIIKCRFDKDGNKYLYDINEYYEKNMKKAITNKIKCNINEKDVPKLLGKKKEKEKEEKEDKEKGKEKENNKNDSHNKKKIKK